jgi:hypothetical protein
MANLALRRRVRTCRRLRPFPGVHREFLQHQLCRRQQMSPIGRKGRSISSRRPHDIEQSSACKPTDSVSRARSFDAGWTGFESPRITSKRGCSGNNARCDLEILSWLWRGLKMPHRHPSIQRKDRPARGGLSFPGRSSASKAGRWLREPCGGCRLWGLRV